jgi:hypothetical protein
MNTEKRKKNISQAIAEAIIMIMLSEPPMLARYQKYDLAGQSA